MFFSRWLDTLQSSLNKDLSGFSPELVICAGIVFMLVLRLFNRFNRLHLGSTALLITTGALVAAINLWMEGEAPIDWMDSLSNSGGRSELLRRLLHGGGVRPEPPVDMFTGMLAYDKFSIFLKMFLYGFTSLVIWLTILTGIPDREDSADFYTLLLGATLGMSVMASANHLLMVFIGIEMASLPSYALAGFLKGRRQSSEAALKYVVYGGGASGVMLYGISLLAGKFGTGYLPDLAIGYSSALREAASAKGGFDIVLLLGTILVLAGVGFKLAAFPFHFWCPDVFEGAAAEVAGFLSVASKGAALALLGRFCLEVAGLTLHRHPDWGMWLQAAKYFAPGLAIFAALTATFGNLAAYFQTNLKRLLAYSTIAHAGYMMMGLATMTQVGAAAVLFYLVAYLFMNLGAFAVVAFLRNQTGSEELSSYRGLIYRSPFLVVTLGVFIFSLLGVPPLGGFAAKFQIFYALFDAAKLYGGYSNETLQLPHSTTLSYTMYALLLVGGLNTVVSLFYYIKVLKVMILDKPIEEIEGVQAAPLKIPRGCTIFAGVLAVAVIVTGTFFEDLARASDRGVQSFFFDFQENSSRPRPQPRPRPNNNAGQPTTVAAAPNQPHP